jgi:hypothetical protein
MTNELLEELWETRRKIEGEKQENLEKLLTKFKKKAETISIQIFLR